MRGDDFKEALRLMFTLLGVVALFAFAFNGERMFCNMLYNCGIHRDCGGKWEITNKRPPWNYKCGRCARSFTSPWVLK